MVESTAESQGSRVAAEVAPDGALVGAARTVETAARHLKEKVVQVKDKLAEKSLGDLVTDGREFVRENPGTSILVAAGVGALVGYLIGRRRS